jgi:hypothetical protein
MFGIKDNTMLQIREEELRERQRASELNLAPEELAFYDAVAANLSQIYPAVSHQLDSRRGAGRETEPKSRLDRTTQGCGKGGSARGGPACVAGAECAARALRFRHRADHGASRGFVRQLAGGRVKPKQGRPSSVTLPSNIPKSRIKAYYLP